VSATQDVTPAPIQGHLAFAGYDQGAMFAQDFRGGMTLSLITQSGEEALGDGLGRAVRRASAARFDLTRGPWRFGAQAGAGAEDGSVVGMAWNTRWGGGANAASRFAGFSGAWTLAPDWDLGFETEWGGVRMDGGGWIQVAQELRTSAGAVALRWRTLPK